MQNSEWKKRSNINHLPSGVGNYEWLMQNIKNEFKKRCKAEYFWQVKYQSTSQLQVLAIAEDASWKVRNWGGDTAAVEGPAPKSRFDQLLPSDFYFVKCTMDTVVAYFKRINYSMIQRGVYSLYMSSNLCNCIEVTNLAPMGQVLPSLAVYPGVTQPQFESRNLSSIHSTSSIGW